MMSDSEDDDFWLFQFPDSPPRPRRMSTVEGEEDPESPGFPGPPPLPCRQRGGNLREIEPEEHEDHDASTTETGSSTSGLGQQTQTEQGYSTVQPRLPGLPGGFSPFVMEGEYEMLKEYYPQKELLNDFRKTYNTDGIRKQVRKEYKRRWQNLPDIAKDTFGGNVETYMEYVKWHIEYAVESEVQRQFTERKFNASRNRPR